MGFTLGLGWAASAEASAWTQAKGNLWWKLGVSGYSATEKFANDTLDTGKSFPDGRPVQPGDRIPFDFQTGGRYRVATVVLEAAYGLFERLEVFAKAPWHATEFSNDNDEVEPGRGLGDVRLGAAVRLFQGGRWVFSSSLEWKLPTADLPRSIYQQPLGEGQTDWTLRLRAGRSLWPYGWLNAEAGYRWRNENRDFQLDPGDERLLELEAGWTASSRVAIKVGFSGLWGDPWVDTSFDARQELNRRTLLTLGPSLLYSLSERWTLEVGAAFSLAGEDLPAGTLVRVGLMNQLGPRTP